jgi:hypothetical protein
MQTVNIGEPNSMSLTVHHVPHALLLLSLSPFSPSIDIQEQNNKSVSQPTSIQSSHLVLKHLTNPAAAPHPQLERSCSRSASTWLQMHVDSQPIETSFVGMTVSE